MKPMKQIHGSELIIALVLLTAAVPVGAAETRNPTANWDNLNQLAPGDDIRIVLDNAKAYTAKLESVNDSGIVVRLASGEQTFPRGTVLRVSTKGRSHRLRNAFIGLAAGAGTGVTVGFASPELGQGKCSRGSCVDAGTVSALGVWGAALGAGMGALIPTGRWHDVYRAR
jgi:hypothetical protein